MAKKKKSPAVARNKGTPIDLSDREIPEEKEEEVCEEVVKKDMIRGTITSYTNKQVTIQYDESKTITHEIENRFLTFSKNILFEKKWNNKEKKDKVTIIYMQLLPKDLQGIEIDNLALKINRFPLVELKNKDEVKFHFQDSYCVEYEQEKITDYYIKIKKLGLNYFDKSYETSYRLVIGGEATVYETSMRLHHIYGIPYIPASGIKGVVRSYIITEKFEEQLKKYDKYSDFEEKVLFVKDEKGEYKEKGFVDVFGSQEQEGKVTFFDAFPTAKPTLKVDIINPIDEDKIINFLTVENTTFRFMMGAKKGLEAFMIQGKKIEDWLTEALRNHGLGAKTAVGYGYF
jgi:CRISPR-associated protein Cmr6